MYDVNKAFQDYVPAQERIDILNAAIERATRMKNQVIKDSRYCSVCDKYYFKKECHIDSRKIKETVCLNPLTGGYLDPYEYEEQEITEFYNICPEGHEMGVCVEWHLS